MFFNFNCVVLDVMQVTIGSNVLFGPSVQIYTATHPISAVERRKWLESAKPITIGSDVWVGGGAIAQMFKRRIASERLIPQVVQGIVMLIAAVRSAS